MESVNNLVENVNTFSRNNQQLRRKWNFQKVSTNYQNWVKTINNCKKCQQPSRNYQLLDKSVNKCEESDNKSDESVNNWVEIWVKNDNWKKQP